jgi:type VI secretion system protein ImpK
VREAMLKIVQPVILYALDLKDRLGRGEVVQVDQEQAALKVHLLSEVDSYRFNDFGARRSQSGDDSDSFLGCRYALTCWLDEIFILDPKYGKEWQEKKLEVSLYGTNDRAWQFWTQMRLAESLQSPDALEVFFLCVMLGFRGELRDDPGKLQDWMNMTRTRLLRDLTGKWLPPVSGKLSGTANPLRGLQRMRQIFFLAWAIILLAIPTIAFLLVCREINK